MGRASRGKWARRFERGWAGDPIEKISQKIWDARLKRRAMVLRAIDGILLKAKNEIL